MGDVKTLCREAAERIEKVHIAPFLGMKDPVFLISDTYPGVWLEHVYDSVFYALQHPERVDVAIHTLHLFIDRQKEDGQLPFCVLNGAKVNRPPEKLAGYSQIQECVSFARLCYMVCGLVEDRNLLEWCYEACAKWVNWIAAHRMTTGRGLTEMFVGYDTGHDNSSRLAGLTCDGLYAVDGVAQNAAILPPNDPVAPIGAVDMSCNYYGNLITLAKMARELGREEEANAWDQRAKDVKQALFAHCYDREDAFFYDVDKNGRKRKYLSSTIFHLFIEEVLDPEEDKALIEEIYTRHIKNPAEFWTEYPFPSMAMNDPSIEGHKDNNCWGYYSQGLIALRATLWMDRYGFGRDMDYLCEKWVQAWTKHSDKVRFGQELDPITGVPTACSQYYSSCMLFYLYAAKRLGMDA